MAQKVFTMKHIKTSTRRKKFDVLASTRLAQAAMMILRAGAKSDAQLSNEHPRCEQWLFVISGFGVATIVPRARSRRTVKLRPGSLLVIGRGELHQIRSLGDRPCRTINFYVPPGYTDEGELRPNAKKRL